MEAKDIHKEMLPVWAALLWHLIQKHRSQLGFVTYLLNYPRSCQCFRGTCSFYPLLWSWRQNNSATKKIAGMTVFITVFRCDRFVTVLLLKFVNPKTWNMFNLLGTGTKCISCLLFPYDTFYKTLIII
jgi:hypothetical protein